MIFRRSAVSQYKDKSGGLAGILHSDSTAVRLVVFLAMSAIFFLFLVHREIDHGPGTQPNVESQPITLAGD